MQPKNNSIGLAGHKALTATVGPLSNNTSATLISPNSLSTKASTQSSSAPVYGFFSGEFHEESDIGGPSCLCGHIHLVVTMAGPLISSDSTHYTPTGTWQVHLIGSLRSQVDLSHIRIVDLLQLIHIAAIHT